MEGGSHFSGSITDFHSDRASLALRESICTKPVRPCNVSAGPGLAASNGFLLRNRLVLMDEIGRGTSTFDGLALAISIARHLIERNQSYTLFATHYFELTRLDDEYSAAANVHVSAVEHKDRIVFLHTVKDGPASQSYGNQVTQLAGVPHSVVKTAQQQLAELEREAAAHSPQQDLFAGSKSTAPITHPVLEALESIDPDIMSPRQALETLFDLKDKAKNTFDDDDQPG